MIHSADMPELERWYIGVSLFVGLFVPIVPAALGHFGWDPLFQVCWIRADNDKERVRNFVLDLYLWQILSCVIASVAVIAVSCTCVSTPTDPRRSSSSSAKAAQLLEHCLAATASTWR